MDNCKLPYNKAVIIYHLELFNFYMVANDKEEIHWNSIINFKIMRRWTIEYNFSSVFWSLWTTAKIQFLTTQFMMEQLEVCVCGIGEREQTISPLLLLYKLKHSKSVVDVLVLLSYFPVCIMMKFFTNDYWVTFRSH